MTETTDDPKTTAFLEGLTLIMVDLDKARTHGPNVVAMIGSLADRLCTDAGKSDWPEVKAGLGKAELQSLIDTLSHEIEDSGKKGEIKPAYAMQAIAASLVGSTFSDERVSMGVALLDDFITDARNFFVANRPVPN